MTYPMEVFKDEYYRLVRSPEEHKQALGDGWVDKRPEGHPYLPISAKGSPKTAIESPAQITKFGPIEYVQKEPKTADKPPVPDVAMFAEAKRGPGRPPNPKPEST